MSNNPTRVVTNEVRFSYVNLLKPRSGFNGDDEKYSVTILLPKSDVVTKQKIDAAIEAAKQKGKETIWNGIIPPNVAIPIHDGDGVRPSDGMPFGPECKGHWVFTATTSVDYPPKIVDVNLNPILDPTEVYSGMYGRIAINFSPYNFAGKKGIGCYISTNVQKTRDGEPLGAAAPDASEDFGGQPITQAQPTAQQPQYQQPVQQYQSMPPNNQPMVQQSYQQPIPQNPQPTPQGQSMQQIDPVTGQPIGGVFGI